MSGGSYDYLYSKSITDIMESCDLKTNVKAMADRLSELGYDIESAASVGVLTRILEIEALITKTEKSMEHIQKVWKEVEWLDSSDTGLDTFAEHMKKIKNEYIR